MPRVLTEATSIVGKAGLSEIDPQALHAIYLAHHANLNKIVSNRFVRNSGNPIKTRNYSNYNLMQLCNFFDLCGHSEAAYYDFPTASRESTRPGATPSRRTRSA